MRKIIVLGSFCSSVGIAISKLLKSKDVDVVQVVDSKESEEPFKQYFPMTAESIEIKNILVSGHETVFYEKEPSKFMSKPKHNFKKR